MSNIASNYIGNLDTLIAVIIGAVLATGGALIAEKAQARASIKQRERQAARRLGHILFDVDRSLVRTFRSQTIGEPWGLATRFSYISTGKLGEWFFENRDYIFDIQDMQLRLDLSEDVSFLLNAITGLIELSEQIDARETKVVQDRDLSEKVLQDTNDEIKQLHQTREMSVNYVQHQLALVQKLYPKLEALAEVKFSANSDSNRHTPAHMRENPKDMLGNPVSQQDTAET